MSIGFEVYDTSMAAEQDGRTEYHGQFDTIEEAHGCIAFDGLTEWHILRAGTVVEGSEDANSVAKVHAARGAPPAGKRWPITSVESQVYIDEGELPDADEEREAPEVGAQWGVWDTVPQAWLTGEDGGMLVFDRFRFVALAVVTETRKRALPKGQLEARRL